MLKSFFKLSLLAISSCSVANADTVPSEDGVIGYFNHQGYREGAGTQYNSAAENAISQLDGLAFTTGGNHYALSSPSLVSLVGGGFTYSVNYTTTHSNGNVTNFSVENTGFFQTGKICANPNYPEGFNLGGSELVTCAPQSCPNSTATSTPVETDSSVNAQPNWGDLVMAAVRFVANPISCSSGQKVESDVVYTSTGPDALTYTTYYSSPQYANGQPTPTDIWNIYNGFGRGNNHFKRIDNIYSDNGKVIYRINSRNKAGHYFYGNASDSNLTAKNDKSGSLSIASDGAYVHTKSNGMVYTYNASGQLVTRVTASGLTRQYTYDSAGNLKTVTNHFGQTLTYDYNTNGLLEKLTTPENTEYHFAYDSASNLIKIIYPDNTPSDLSDNPTIQYLFENALYPNHMTGKINEKGVRLATWHYDTNGRAISSEHANGLEKVELDYSVDNETRVKTYVSGAVSNDKTFKYAESFVNRGNKKQLIAIETLPCEGCEVGSWKYSYDKNGYLSQSISPAGMVTQFTHDANGFETQRISGFGTAQAKTIDTVWDTTHRRVTKTTLDNLQTEYFYDANRQLSSVTLTDLISGETRTTTYTYNSNGLIETVDGPRADVSDITTYSYDANGNVNTITNALNHVVTFDNYDASGRVGQVTDANGVITTMTYTPRGWLATTTANGLTTEYQYYATGSLKKVILPAGQTLEYFYDDGERLTAVQDNAGNRMEYTLDLMGNITKSEIKDPQGVVKFSQTQVFNALGQLSKTLGNNNQFTEVSYDADGAPTTSTNAKSQTTSSTLDAIKRVTKTVDAAQGETTFAYNRKNQITKVTDPENRDTVYTYNNFGELTKLTSPDTGITTYTYDAAGNLKTKTDAKNITVTYSYDALNRLISQTYPDTTQNVTYVYDDVTSGNKGIGRLTSVTETTGSTSYEYNSFGLLSKETRVINGKSYTTGYDLDAYGRVSTVTYPSGRTFSYTFNSLGQVEALSTDKNGSVTTLASNTVYLPFGPLTHFNFGNGIASTRNYDLDYRLDDKSNSLRVVDYQYDLVDNINGTTDSLVTDNNQSYSYDNLNRLTTRTDNANNQTAFAYDKVGNRARKNTTQSNDFYNYDNKSRLVGVTQNGLGMTPSENAVLPFTEWRFEEEIGNATVLDHYGTNNGSVQGSLTFKEPANNNIGNSAYFDGNAGNFIDVGNPNNLWIYNGTIEAWIKTDDAGTGGRGIVVKPMAYNIFLVDNELAVYDYKNWKWHKAGIYLNDNQWHQIVFSFNDNTAGANLYVDGVEVLSFTWRINRHFAEGLAIGAHSSAGANFKGHIDNVRVFNQVLTPQQLFPVDTAVLAQPEFIYDANGNTIQKGDFTFTYNDANRMASSTIGGITTTYQYNAKGERSVKTRNGVEIHFVYGPNGQLIAEADGQGNVTKEYVYFDGQPLAQIVGDDIYYYHNSHLGTPEMLTDANQNIVWQASYTSFGKATVTNEAIVNNIRFPGQYYDSESGLHYNYFRDYDPEIGRYVQSDPIGLNGGINTYAYVGGNPVNSTDRLGLVDDAVFSFGMSVDELRNYHNTNGRVTNGASSFFRAMARAVRQAARRKGLYGKCEKGQTKKENQILLDMVDQYNNDSDTQSRVDEAVQRYINTHHPEIAGRFAASTVTNFLITRRIPGVGTRMTAAAVNGSALFGASSSGDVALYLEYINKGGAQYSIEEAVAAALTGELDELISNIDLDKECGCKE